MPDIIAQVIITDTREIRRQTAAATRRRDPRAYIQDEFCTRPGNRSGKP